MPNLKVLRKRIRSVKNTQQITKAMKMVAAAKLRRAQERAVAPRAYTERMRRLIRTLATRLADTEGLHPLLAGSGDVRKVEIVMCTADRGLCGSFNSSVIRAVRQRVTELQQQGFQVSLTCIGRKGYDVLKRQYEPIMRKRYSTLGRELTFRRVNETVMHDLLTAYENGEFDACYLVFNTFKSAMSQDLTWKQLIPAPVEKSTDKEPAPYSNSGNYLFEPSSEELLEELLRRAISGQLLQAMLESEASEHGARMSAMDSAVRNAGEMIRKLTTSFNRTRQAAITTELMEIIGGAESLKG